MEIDMAIPMTRRLMVLAAAAAVLGACATTPPPILAPAASPLAATGAEIIFGCTAKADFAFFVERQGQATTLAFGRRRVDPCRAAAHHVDLTFTYEELGLRAREPVFMLNPLIADRGL
ncbi:MAG TPA: hypothetical protein PKB04_12645 [Phenylobacterium sp.]|nr:hypothetical protein [Phenylobacterium sp.]